MRLEKKKQVKSLHTQCKTVKKCVKVMVYTSFSSGQNKEQWGQKVA